MGKRSLSCILYADGENNDNYFIIGPEFVRKKKYKLNLILI